MSSEQRRNACAAAEDSSSSVTDQRKALQVRALMPRMKESTKWKKKGVADLNTLTGRAVNGNRDITVEILQGPV